MPEQPAASGAAQAILENRKIKMEGPLGAQKMFIKSARVIEGFSQITRTTVDFMSTDKQIDLATIVGQPITVKVQKGEEGSEAWRDFKGTCVEARTLGVHEGYGFYSLEVRSWLWFLTRTGDNRVYQEKNAVDIIKDIFSRRGFADFNFQVNRTPAVRQYCVQYGESDYDFICRLLDEEGIYFFSKVQSGKDHLMLVDDMGAHTPVEDFASIEFATREAEYRRTQDHIFEWRPAEGVVSGKVTLRDYNFETPSADMTVVKSVPRGSHGHKSYELYDYHGRYRQTSEGEIHARVRLEAEQAKFSTRTGIGNVRTLATGTTFNLTGYNRAAENQAYVITGATHILQIEVQQEDETQQVKDLPGSIEIDEENRDSYRCTFSAVPKSIPYRAPLDTPWPQIPGILLAKVVGPSGEEIHTDQYGRIKVQFPWDRVGSNNETSSCFVRVVTPWSGKDWGMVHVPRIGQEVVIMFEDGNIDRPICTGMLYNAETMPPYTLPDNMTQMGIKTRSSKGGGTDNYNELVFEDKKDAEFIRIHSEKDFFLTVENDATISIGETKQNPGSVTTTIYKDRIETIKTGDLTLKVETGNENRDIKTNRTEKIGGNAEQTVTGNKKTEVTGNTETKTTGNYKEDVTGTSTTKVTGAITIESMASIELKVMGSSIKIDSTGVTIKAPMITTKANAMAEHDGGGMMTIKGGIVMIN